MRGKADHLVDEYLKRLKAELAGIPRRQQRELIDEIVGHIAEARRGFEAENEAEIRNLLERLGDPAEIAAEERVRLGAEPRRAGAVEIFALIALLVGGFFAVVGWFVGLVLLWVSDAWTTRDKLVGSLVVPGGLLPAFLLLTGAVGGYSETCSGETDPATGQFVETCTGGPSAAGQIFRIGVFILCVIGPFFTTIYLARRMKRTPSMTYQPSSGAA
jgi:hypothetical protein